MSSRTVAQALHHLIHNAGDGVMTKLYLLKTIYLADRYHLRKYGRSITDSAYVAMEMGPVATQVKNMIEADANGDGELSQLFVPIHPTRKTGFRSLCKPTREYLSDTELEALNAALDQFRKVGAGRIVDYTHEFPEWKNCKEMLGEHRKVVPMNIEDFFSSVDAKFEYCPADPELVEMNLDFYRGEV